MNKTNARLRRQGHLHPLTHIKNDMVRIFDELGFSVASGPEVETEEYNFDKLNVPPDHPARDLWDTFWLKPENSGKLLRTHTSNVQIRHMEKHEPPLAIIVPGKVYRYEATDATHESEFFQLEGLMVGRDVSLATLKGVLQKFFSEFFGKELKVRLRPSFFPFVEPGVEIDLSCFKCSGEADCSVCKGTSWIEVMGAGQVHPYVLNGVGIDPREYQGFAFGMGIDRMMMLKYEVDDVRLSHSGDLRVTNQF